jgi:hypothetical protein
MITQLQTLELALQKKRTRNTLIQETKIPIQWVEYGINQDKESTLKWDLLNL